MSTTHTIGSRVSFLPGPRSTSRVTGTVKDIVTSGEGKGRSTFLVVACDDNRERKIRPGGATAA